MRAEAYHRAVRAASGAQAPPVDLRLAAGEGRRSCSVPFAMQRSTVSPWRTQPESRTCPRSSMAQKNATSGCIRMYTKWWNDPPAA